MAVLDANLRVSNKQALTATAYSTDSINLGLPTASSPNAPTARDIGAGEGVTMQVTIDTAADITTGDETYEFQCVQSANEDLSSHTVLESRVVAASRLKAGDMVLVPLPPGAITQQYLGARYVLGGTSPSVTVTTFFQPRDMSSLPKPASYGTASRIS